MIKYFVFAGESSGDLHGSRLIHALKNGDDDILVSGVGGPRMRSESFDCFLPMEEFQVMGFSDVLRALPKLYKYFYQIRGHILKTEPDCVILIDYPGFNLRLAHSLRKKGFKGKLVQYICPTVWAHGKDRIELLTKNYDLLLTIFPFEAGYFAHTNLNVKYIGNPLIDTLSSHSYQKDWIKKIGLSPEQELIALFPGSRRGEVLRHMPQQLKIAFELKEKHPFLRFAIACAHENLYQTLVDFIEKSPLKINKDIYIIPSHEHYDLMKNCKTALAKSGTVTLELALHSTPTVVHYEVTPLNYLFAKYLLKLDLPHYCIVNILKKETLFPEFVGKNLSTDAIKDVLEQLHFDPFKYRKIQSGCERIKETLGVFPSHQEAAKAIQEMIKC